VMTILKRVLCGLADQAFSIVVKRKFEILEAK